MTSPAYLGLYPALHVHSYAPGVFLHVAFSQTFSFPVKVHSSISSHVTPPSLVVNPLWHSHVKLPLCKLLANDLKILYYIEDQVYSPFFEFEMVLTNPFRKSRFQSFSFVKTIKVHSFSIQTICMNMTIMLIQRTFIIVITCHQISIKVIDA